MRLIIEMEITFDALQNCVCYSSSWNSIAPSLAGRGEERRGMQTGGVCPAAARSWMLEWTVDARGGLFCRRCGILLRFMHCSRRIRHANETMEFACWEYAPCVSNSATCLDSRHHPTCLFALLEEHIFRPHLFRLNHFLFNWSHHVLGCWKERKQINSFIKFCYIKCTIS